MIGRLRRAWESYWFRPEPLLDLAVFRILATGGQILIYLFIARPDQQTVEVSGIPHMYEPLAVGVAPVIRRSGVVMLKRFRCSSGVSIQVWYAPDWSAMPST